MPRLGLAGSDVTVAGAEIADEVGYANLTLGMVAARLGVRAPSLYKHVDGLPDLRHRIATLATSELDEAVREAMLGLAGRDALEAMARAVRSYVIAHPGRYAATIGAEFTGPDDPLLEASTRLIESIAAVLRGYGLGEHETVHAIRTLRCTLHGYAMLQISSAFQWSGDAEDSFDWLIDFADRGLRTESMTTTATGASTKRTRRS